MTAVPGGEDVVIHMDHSGAVNDSHQVLNAVTVQEMDMRRPTQNRLAYNLQRKFSSLMAYNAENADVL